MSLKTDKGFIEENVSKLKNSMEGLRKWRVTPEIKIHVWKDQFGRNILQISARTNAKNDKRIFEKEIQE